MEMVKVFQLQLEHYEKVEGSALSLEGKANQLSQMVRNNLPAAMQGLVVVPIFAGYDLRRRVGRLFTYDVTGGRYEEREFSATGSGSLHAGTVIKLGFRSDMTSDQAVELASRPCTKRPIPTRPRAGPTCCDASSRWSRPSRRRVATSRRRRPRRPLPCPAGEAGAPVVWRPRRHEHALLRTARAGDEGPRRLRPQGHLPWPQPDRHGLRRGRRHRGREPSNSLHKVSEIYDRIAFAGVGKYNEFDQLRVAGVRAADMKGFCTAATTSTPAASPTSTRRSSARSSPTR